MTKADDATFYISLNNYYNFYDTLFDYIYVCTNGFISMDYITSTSISSFSNLVSPLVAGLAVDLDTRYSGNIYYRETNDIFILDSLKSYILEYNSSTDTNSLFLNSAFIVTYDSVPFYANNSTTNSFQIIITTTPTCETFAIVIYKYLSTGLASYYAGYSAKNGILYKQLENDDLLYLVNNPSLIMPNFIVFKLSNDNAELTCGKKVIFYFQKKRNFKFFYKYEKVHHQRLQIVFQVPLLLRFLHHTCLHLNIH